MRRRKDVPSHITDRLAIALLRADARTVEEIREGLASLLNPATILEQMRVEELAGLEVELIQCKRQRDIVIIKTARTVAFDHFYKRLPAATGADGKRDLTIVRTSYDLFSEDKRRHQAVVDRLAALDVTLEDVCADAYDEVFEQVENYEKRIVSLEYRRRRLMEDWRSLQYILGKWPRA